MKHFAILLLSVSLLAGTARAQTIQGTYAIRNAKTGLLLRVQDARAAEGTPLVAYPATNWKCMTWDFQHVAGNAYRLQNLLTHKTFQPTGTPAAGVALQEHRLEPNQAQQWAFEPGPDKTYRIRLQGTSLYVTPVDATGATNTPIVLAEKADNPLQFWTIYMQHPTM